MELLKNIGRMSQQELSLYWQQLTKWRNEDYPRLCALTDAWTENDVKDYQEGVRLCSALRSARDFCTAPMHPDIQRRLKSIRWCLSEIDRYVKCNKIDIAIVSAVDNSPKRLAILPPKPVFSEDGDIIEPELQHILTPDDLPLSASTTVPSHSCEGSTPEAGDTSPSASTTVPSHSCEGSTPEAGAVAPSASTTVPSVFPEGSTPEAGDTSPSAPSPRRGRGRPRKGEVVVKPPKPAKPEDVPEQPDVKSLVARSASMATYVDRLPADLQAEYLNLKGWYLELTDLHYRLEFLVDDPRSSKSDRQQLATLCAKVECRILNFYHRVDVALEELEGKTVSDETKERLENERRACSTEEHTRSKGEYSYEEIEAMEDGPEKIEFRKSRIERNRRYLRRNDRRNKDLETLKQAATELHKWGVPITQDSADKAKALGFIIPDNWINISPQEARASRMARNSIPVKPETPKERRAREKAEKAERWKEIGRQMGVNPDEPTLFD